MNNDKAISIVTSLGNPDFLHEYANYFLCTIEDCYRSKFSADVVYQHAGRLRALSRLIFDCGVTEPAILCAAKQRFKDIPAEDLDFILCLISSYYTLHC